MSSSTQRIMLEQLYESLLIIEMLL